MWQAEGQINSCCAVRPTPTKWNRRRSIEAFGMDGWPCPARVWNSCPL